MGEGLDQARAAGLDVSRLAAAALAEEIDRRAKLAELDAYLAALDAELGLSRRSNSTRPAAMGRRRAAG